MHIMIHVTKCGYKHLFAGFCIGILLFTGGLSCSIQKLAVGATSGIVNNTLTAIYTQSDLVYAEKAIPGNLALLDGLIKSDPNNKDVLLNAVIGYTGYALGFVEDQDPERAVAFYAKARDYGLTLLAKNKALKNIRSSNLEDLEAALLKTRKKDVPALFWTANAWGSYIKLSLDDIYAVADLGKVEAIMNRVLELDETFYFGGAHLFLGVMEIEKGIAGKPDKSKEHFERALEISERKFLLTQVMYARHYAVNRFDKELFDTLLKEVLDTQGDVLPEYRLINEIAKKKAELYLSMKDEWFEN